MLEIYYAPPSIYGRKALAVLDEKGLDYKIKKMSFTTQDHLKPEYLAINPNGEIPTLVDDGFTVYESTAIIEYLNDEYPEPPLLPEDSAGRARARMIEDYCDLHLYPALVKCLIKKVYKNEPISEDDKSQLAGMVKRLETYLGNQEFIAGKTFTLADCAMMAAIVTFEGLDMGAIVNTKALSSYINKMKKRSGYKGASLIKLEEEALTE